ncbi:unnamed protein product, partial [marine sediment metagenome]
GTLPQYCSCTGVGYSVFKDTSSPVLLTAGTSQQYTGLIIDGDSTAAYGIQATGNSTEFTRVKIQNTTSYDYYNSLGSLGNIIKYSIFGITLLQATTSEIDTCFYNSPTRSIIGHGDATKRTVLLEHNKLIVDLTAQSATTRQLFELRGNIALTIIDNNVTTSVIRGWFGRLASGTNNDNQLVFSYNNCTDILNDNDLYYLRVAEGTYQRFTTIQIDNNAFTMNDDLLYSAVRIEGNDVATIYNNNITTNGTTSGGGVNVLYVNTSVNVY